MHIDATGVGHKFRNGDYLFADLDFAIHGGEVIALTGPSGSGKTTLLHILARWTPPTQGRVEYDGVETIRWVFQNPHGVNKRTALDHVVLPLLARGLTRDQAENEAELLLNDFALGRVRRSDFRRLSGGEAQRLMLARALASSPDLLLVDEPTAQLDRANATTVIAALKALAGRGTIVVIATHDPDVAHACTRRIAVAVSK